MSEDSNENPLSDIEAEFQQINQNWTWHSHYALVRDKCMFYNYTSYESKQPQNRLLNRYRDVHPYDHTRIILKRGPCDYINANLLKIEEANRQYILTQGPLPNTAGHFWLMVWEQNSKAIIMLNKVIERNEIKCHQYWPLENSTCDSMTFPDVGLKVEFVRKLVKNDHILRTLSLTDMETNESREILHFHYVMWPDYCAPSSPKSFLRFLADIRKSGALDPNNGPPIVHCSAGIGRTGTFCLVDTSLVLIEKNGINSLKLINLLLEMRKSRMGLIQTPDQLRFSYAAIIQGAQQLSANNNIYEEVDVNNHYDEVTNSSIEEDEPPPLPPPRSESLIRRNMIVDTSESQNEIADSEGLNDKPLPSEPSNNNLSNNTAHTNDSQKQNKEENAMKDDLSSQNTETAPSQLRQRQIEKTKRLTEKVCEMKRRQKKSEEWQRLKRSLFSPVSLIGAAIASGGVLAICGYLYLRG